jgi:hypothetical protein
MKLVTVLILSIFASADAWAQKDGAYATSQIDGSIPVVPLEVVTSGGRQTVISYLTVDIETVGTAMAGQSIVGQWEAGNHFLDHDQMQALGYRNRGDFAQLSQVISALDFSGNVVPNAYGNYDVRIDITCYNVNNQICLKGAAWPNLSDGPEDTVRFRETHPSLWIPSQVAVEINGVVAAARWLNSNGGYEDLQTSTDGDTSKIVINDYMFDDGDLVITRSENDPKFGITKKSESYNLVTGATVDGKVFMGRLATSMSADITAVQGLGELDQFQFYRENDGQLYGHYPLVNWTLPHGFLGHLTIEVPVYGTQKKIAPSKIIIKVIGTQPPYVPGAIFPVNNGDLLRIEQGVYHIELFFDGVKDWNQYPGGLG